MKKDNLLGLASMAALAGVNVDKLVCSIKKQRKCLLPECENMTDHNGGYCCADHCKMHRAMNRAASQISIINRSVL